ncbi:MAG: hypothetical protein D6694_14480 [Gammaproteobacteria bacterium]|nr:MAG: hypothetical protein D6694_14480 [Gammaproteobacteria bacterium]
MPCSDNSAFIRSPSLTIRIGTQAGRAGIIECVATCRTVSEKYPHQTQEELLMRANTKWMAIFMLILGVAACSKSSVAELATGRWAAVDGSTVVLVNLPKGVFEIYAVSQGAPFRLLKAKNLKVLSEQQDPQQAVVTYIANGGQPKKVIFRLLWKDDNHFNLALVDPLTGKVEPLVFVSEKATLRD